MTEWIVTNEEHWRKTPYGRRYEVHNWLQLNGIKPSLVPLDSEIVVRENSDGIWVIDFEEYRTDSRGRIRFDSGSPSNAERQARTVVMEIDPPLYLMSGQR